MRRCILAAVLAALASSAAAAGASSDLINPERGFRLGGEPKPKPLSPRRLQLNENSPGQNWMMLTSATTTTSEVGESAFADGDGGGEIVFLSELVVQAAAAGSKSGKSSKSSKADSKSSKDGSKSSKHVEVMEMVSSEKQTNPRTQEEHGQADAWPVPIITANADDGSTQIQSESESESKSGKSGSKSGKDAKSAKGMFLEAGAATIITTNAAAAGSKSSKSSSKSGKMSKGSGGESKSGKMSKMLPDGDVQGGPVMTLTTEALTNYPTPPPTESPTARPSSSPTPKPTTGPVEASTSSPTPAPAPALRASLFLNGGEAMTAPCHGGGEATRDGATGVYGATSPNETLIRFKYEMSRDKRTSDGMSETILPALESALIETAMASLVPCGEPLPSNSTRKRHRLLELQPHLYIVGISSRPADKIVSGEECRISGTDPNAECYVIDGRMTAYLRDGADPLVAEEETKAVLKALMEGNALASSHPAVLGVVYAGDFEDEQAAGADTQLLGAEPRPDSTKPSDGGSVEDENDRKSADSGSIVNYSTVLLVGALVVIGGAMLFFFLRLGPLTSSVVGKKHAVGKKGAAGDDSIQDVLPIPTDDDEICSTSDSSIRQDSI